MPAGVSDTSLPCIAVSSVVNDISIGHVGISWSGVLGGFSHVHFASERRVNIVDVDTAIFATGVHISRIGTAWWGKMASDQRLQHAVTPVGDQGAVMGMRGVLLVRIRHEAVVEARGPILWFQFGRFLRGHHFPQIPELH